MRRGQVLEVDGPERAVVQVFEGTSGVDGREHEGGVHWARCFKHAGVGGHARAHLQRKSGKPIDEGPAGSCRRTTSTSMGMLHQPIATRTYPEEMIQTGIAAIDVP